MVLSVSHDGALIEAMGLLTVLVGRHDRVTACVEIVSPFLTFGGSVQASRDRHETVHGQLALLPAHLARPVRGFM